VIKVIKKNYVKEKIKSGDFVIGCFNTIGSPLVAEILASAGFDFIIIDFEHGPFKLGDTQLFVNACERYLCSPIVRIPSLTEWMALQALDQGAHGIIVPHVNDRKKAKKVVDMTKYSPQGERGFTPFSKAGGFTNRDASTYAERANQFTLTGVIIESKGALDNLDTILEVENLDVVYFGAYDLSQDLGYPGQVKHPKVIEAIRPKIERVLKAGKCPGGFVAQTTDDVKWQIELGLKFIAFNVDTDLIFYPAKMAVDSIKIVTGGNK
jgi:4-hydroxy-2-oxoheptanedioate aldolase